jgi:hypothetical protein
MYPDVLTLTVTEEDREKANQILKKTLGRGLTHNCTVAQAAKRRFSNDSVWCSLAILTLSGAQYLLSEELANFIEQEDAFRDMPVHAPLLPQTFTLRKL